MVDRTSDVLPTCFSERIYCLNMRYSRWAEITINISVYDRDIRVAIGVCESGSPLHVEDNY